jgi:hypothetical protein
MQKFNSKIVKMNESECLARNQIQLYSGAENYSSWRNSTIASLRQIIPHLEYRFTKYKEEQIAERISYRDESFGTNPGTILKIVKGKKDSVQINKAVLFDPQGNINRIITAPEEVLRHTRKSYIDWLEDPEADIEGLLNDPIFGQYYKPPSESLLRIYADVMNPVTIADVKQSINSQPNKAPGKSQINALLLKNLPIEAMELITLAFNISLKFSIAPKAWLCGMIFPTPKGAVTWDASTGNTRPITLLEILLKSLVGLVSTRIRL